MNELPWGWTLFLLIRGKKDRGKFFNVVLSHKSINYLKWNIAETRFTLCQAPGLNPRFKQSFPSLSGSEFLPGHLPRTVYFTFHIPSFILWFTPSFLYNHRLMYCLAKSPVLILKWWIVSHKALSLAQGNSWLCYTHWQANLLIHSESAVPAKSVLAWWNTSKALGLSPTLFICLFRFVIVKHIAGLRWKVWVKHKAVPVKSLCMKGLLTWQGYLLENKEDLDISSVQSMFPKTTVWLLLSLRTVKGEGTPTAQYLRQDILTVPLQRTSCLRVCMDSPTCQCLWRGPRRDPDSESNYKRTSQEFTTFSWHISNNYGWLT